MAVEPIDQTAAKQLDLENHAGVSLCATLVS
jgi:hypothetical protein